MKKIKINVNYQTLILKRYLKAQFNKTKKTNPKTNKTTHKRQSLKPPTKPTLEPTKLITKAKPKPDQNQKTNKRKGNQELIYKNPAQNKINSLTHPTQKISWIRKTQP